jgi:hypothetical protein
LLEDHLDASIVGTRNLERDADGYLSSLDRKQ